jgi:hypothetical protein
MNREGYLSMAGIADEDLTPDQARVRATALLVQHLGLERASTFSNAAMDAYFAAVPEPDSAEYADEQSAVMDLVRGAWPHLLTKAREVAQHCLKMAKDDA